MTWSRNVRREWGKPLCNVGVRHLYQTITIYTYKTVCALLYCAIQRLQVQCIPAVASCESMQRIFFFQVALNLCWKSAAFIRKEIDIMPPVSSQKGLSKVTQSVTSAEVTDYDVDLHMTLSFSRMKIFFRVKLLC